jgi:hypothetical protein
VTAQIKAIAIYSRVSNHPVCTSSVTSSLHLSRNGTSIKRTKTCKIYNNCVKWIVTHLDPPLSPLITACHYNEIVKSRFGGPHTHCTTRNTNVKHCYRPFLCCFLFYCQNKKTIITTGSESKCKCLCHAVPFIFKTSLCRMCTIVCLQSRSATDWWRPWRSWLRLCNYCHTLSDPLCRRNEISNMAIFVPNVSLKHNLMTFYW